MKQKCSNHQTRFLIFPQSGGSDVSELKKLDSKKVTQLLQDKMSIKLLII
jgi:hypothetical protein